jgi:spore coat polysaccharide biosynthesis protein SpsF
MAILQARMSSSRLPGKIMSPINGTPMIGLQIQRIRRARSIDQLIVATTDNPTDDVLALYLQSIGVDIYRGSLEDVYSRFVGVLETHESEVLLRLTGDCPLVMPELIDQMVEDFLSKDLDYISNTLKPTFPDGLDIEIISTSAFSRLANYELSDLEREHVTMGLYRRPSVFSLANFENGRDLSEERWTVDYAEDFDFVAEIFAGFKGCEASFGLDDVLRFLKENPEIRNKISGRMRNVALDRIAGRNSKDVE